jgi:hypothetical protein
VLFRDGTVERRRADHLDVRSMPQLVHEDFLGIAVRYLQLQTTIRQRGATLMRVPLLLRDDGKRVAVVLYADGTAELKRSTSLTFLLNFFDELRWRVPAKTE